MLDEELPKDIHFGSASRISKVRKCLNDIFPKEITASGKYTYSNEKGDRLAELVVNPDEFYLRVYELPKNMELEELDSRICKIPF